MYADIFYFIDDTHVNTDFFAKNTRKRNRCSK